MKKNLSILLCLLFFTQNIFPDDPATSQIKKLTNVLHEIAQKAIAQQKYNKTIQLDFDELLKPFENKAFTPEISTTREKINKAATTLLKVANKQSTDINAKNFAQELIQPCYLPIVQGSIKKQKLQIKGSLIENTQLEYQMYDILNRIFLLWRVTGLFLHIPNDQKIKLNWPDAELSISEWINLTKQAAQELWTSLNPSIQMAEKIKEEESRLLQEQKLKIETERKEQERKIAAAKEKFYNLKPSQEQLEQSKKIIDTFNKFLSSQKLNHEIFTKYAFNENLRLALTYLLLIQQKFENDEKVPENALLNEIEFLKIKFIEEMNTMYSNYFKKEFAGKIGNKFLVIKHQFKTKPKEPAIPNVPESEAVALLTDLIVLWEIYQTLFPEIPNFPDIISLPYFNQKLSVQNWITTTGNAGFSIPGQFIEELQKSLSKSLPAQETIHLGKIKLSKAVQDLKNGITTIGAAIKESAQKTGEKIYSIWESIKNYVTRHVEDEVDEL